MIGNDVFEIRERYRLSVTDFAELIGTSPSSVYRWESCRYGSLKIEPLQQRILRVMKLQAEEDKDAEAMIESIALSVAKGGGLLGLYCLLKRVYRPGEP